MEITRAIHSKAIDAACEDDRLWFDAHPDHTSRVRRAVPFELNGPMDPGPDHVASMLVLLIGPGLRLRVPFAVPAIFAHVIDAQP